jgi:crotonobetainyl-CoA:carnitine CoA-transferase CaiB-like acyl-CoA transferase
VADALGPLDGFRVLDAGTRIAASFCAGALGELGADVIKVEQPGAGEFLRYLGPLHDGNSLMWSVEGRGRKSITLDLRLREGQALLRRLAERVDVLCENFRPGTMERWRLGPSDLPPSLVYVRVSVFGQTGPLARRPGVDMVGIAHGGLLGLTGYPDGPPMKSNITISDHLTGVFAAKAAVFALFRREVDGDGAVVDASLFGSIFRTLDWRIAAEEEGVPATRSGALDPDLPGLLLIEGADGRYVATGASRPTDLDALTAVIWPGNRPDGGSASRVDSASRVIASALTADELIRELEKAEVPHALVRTPRDIVDEHRLGHMSSELVEVTDPVLGTCLQPAAFPVVLDTDQQPTGAPTVGEHNTEIWCGLVGLSSGELADLMERGVI